MKRGPKPKPRTQEYLDSKRAARRAADKRYREKHREKYNAKRARYREKYRDTLRRRAREYYAADPVASASRTKAWTHRTPEWKCRWGMLASARRRARDRNLECDLTMADINLPDTCPVLGIKLRLVGPMGEDTPTLDRLEPKRGYVRGNVCVISNRANRLKSDATLNEVRAIQKYMEAHLT